MGEEFSLERGKDEGGGRGRWEMEWIKRRRDGRTEEDRGTNVETDR